MIGVKIDLIAVTFNRLRLDVKAIWNPFNQKNVVLGNALSGILDLDAMVGFEVWAVKPKLLAKVSAAKILHCILNKDIDQLS